MKVVKYSQFEIIDNLSEREYQSLLTTLDNRLYEMKVLGAPASEINEGLWDILGKLGGGAVDRLKNYAAGWLLDKMGLPSDNLFLAEWAKNIIEQVEFRKIGSYFGSGSCKKWIEAVVKGLLETLEEKTLGFIFQQMGYDVNFTTGVGGTVLGSVREALTNALNDTNFVNNLSGKLEGTICGSGTSFSTIFGGGKFDEKDIKDAAKSSGLELPKSNDKDAAGLAGLLPGMGQEVTAKKDDGKFNISNFWSMLGV